MLHVTKNHNGAWVISALIADGRSCGPFYKTVTYYHYTKIEACRKYLADYGTIIEYTGDED